MEEGEGLEPIFMKFQCANELKKNKTEQKKPTTFVEVHKEHVLQHSLIWMGQNKKLQKYKI